jgi:predicted O-linked N-acetylglucosamine transferase (SPINDLY family)
MPPVTLEQALALGIGHYQAGRFAPAEAVFRGILAHFPQNLEAHSALAVLYESLSRDQEAIPHCQAGLALAPQEPSLHYNMAVSLAKLGRLEEAAAHYRQAIAFKPDFWMAYHNLADVLRVLDRLDEALSVCQKAIQLKPDAKNAHFNLGRILGNLARHDEAMDACRQTLARWPDDPRPHSNLVYGLLFHPDIDAPTIRQELALWNQSHARPLRSAIRPHVNDRHPDRRLRIGYVSPNFCSHVVGRNILPIFTHHDRNSFEIFCYSTQAVSDFMTENFRQRADHWREVSTLSPEQLAGQINTDRIDILVDLSLHLAGNSLLVFARKPAPVQVTFAGYPGSTGLEAIDYRLSDPYLDPPENDSLYVEKTLRLPHTFWCYEAMGEPIIPNSPPAASTGRITFGNLNHLRKTNEFTFDLWSKVLRAVEGSRLVLLSDQDSHRQRTRDFFRSRGIAPERIEFCSSRPHRAYLHLYHQIDIGLDTLPYNGHTTSLDALWMGVPVVTLVGQTVVGRAGYSQLMNLKHPELITHTPEAFIATATALAADIPRLDIYRATLRPRMETSPLMDIPGFTRGLETAYRQMWQTWCSTPA